MTWSQKIRKKIDAKLVEFRDVKKTKNKEEAELQKIGKLSDVTAKAHQVILNVGEAVQLSSQLALSEIVSKCLKVVFGDEYKFQFEMKRKRNKTVAIPQFFKDGQALPAQNAIGGGIIDVASFAMRITTIAMTSPGVRSLVILDEPFKHVSENYHEKIKDMLEKLSSDLGIQIVMVTHNKKLITGKVIKINPKKIDLYDED